MAEWRPQRDRDKRGGHRHEGADISIPGVVGAAAVLFLALGVHAIALWGLFKVLVGAPASYAVIGAQESSIRIEPPVLNPERVSGPTLQVSPSADLRQMFDQAEKHLNSYGWVNRDAGVVRIPIERAIELKAAAARAADKEGSRGNTGGP